MNLAELFLGQIPEAVYFALFLIFTKELKTKRILFTILMAVEYLLLKSFIHFDMWFQIGYVIMTFLTLKVLYKDKAQITDVFTFGIASIILIILSAISFLIFGPDMKLVTITNRILLILFLALTHKLLPNIQDLYNKLWNRNDAISKKVKSTTFRALNAVVFNLMFVIINLGVLYALLIRR